LLVPAGGGENFIKQKPAWATDTHAAPERLLSIIKTGHNVTVMALNETVQKFISESIKPVIARTAAGEMATGGPALPLEFIWRGKALEIARVIDHWHETGPCKHGSGERYVRKHWFEVETADHRKAKIYFERKARGKQLTERWWLFSIEDRLN
jgi:phosphoribosylglycinamide formyltransferase-1